MPWQDRIREAAYVSPSGVRITFDFENVRRTFDKKTTAFDFPDADGTYIQDNGNTGRRYPMRVFFWGDDYDEQVDLFDAALREIGPGKLEHPRYGVVDVVPFGTITQRDDLVTDANQAVIEVTFWDTIGTIYPLSQNDPASDVLTAVSEYNVVAATEFEEVTSLESAVEQQGLKAVYNVLLNNVKDGLQVIADTQVDVKNQFDSIVGSINNSIDILIATPLTLASQTVQMIQAPARAISNIQARLDGYGNLLDSIVNATDAVKLPGTDSSNSNDFHNDDLYAANYIIGSIVSVINNVFTTQSEALTAAETILDQLDSVIVWRDNNLVSLNEIDTGGAYQKLQQAVALTAGFLVQISFSLKQERSFILDRNRTIVDLAAELYGKGFEDKLDFFISSNDFIGDEILELPRGRNIVYYI